MHPILQLVKKEIVLEYKKQYAFNGILLYVFSTLIVCYLAFKQVNPLVWNTLFWILVVFTQTTAVNKSFQTEHRYRQLYYYQLSSPVDFIFSKMIYNALLSSLMVAILIVFYSIVFKNPVENAPMFYLGVFLGNSALISIMTFIAAIGAQTNNGGTLTAVLGFPLIIPILLLAIRFTKNAMDGLDPSSFYDEMLGLLALNIIVWVLSYILFPYIWTD
jgi:heme exporter protein B